jgi:ABC-type multidrug transport system fused ATPase/permease subunit
VKPPQTSPLNAGRVELRNVNFVYSNRTEQLVLRDISLSIKPCALTAVVGKSGSGKSTLMSLICGLYEPTTREGVVEVHGVNVRDVDRTWLRQQVGVVEQKTALFSGSILENILYGKVHSAC